LPEDPEDPDDWLAQADARTVKLSTAARVSDRRRSPGRANGDFITCAKRFTRLRHPAALGFRIMLCLGSFGGSWE
jgi:hypothetical protein